MRVVYVCLCFGGISPLCTDFAAVCIYVYMMLCGVLVADVCSAIVSLCLAAVMLPLPLFVYPESCLGLWIKFFFFLFLKICCRTRVFVLKCSSGAYGLIRKIRGCSKCGVSWSAWKKGPWHVVVAALVCVGGCMCCLVCRAAVFWPNAECLRSLRCTRASSTDRVKGPLTSGPCSHSVILAACSASLLWPCCGCVLGVSVLVSPWSGLA